MAVYFETKNLSVGYNGKSVIRNISIEIQKGEIITLIGPNGGGKSTILKSITRYLQTISGSVLIADTNLDNYSYQQLAQQMAVVLTERLKPELMTCWDVVASGRYPYTGKMGLLSSEDEQIVIESMKTVHVLELAQRNFNDISDGQRQRVLLARAICQQPEIIVLDEPTSYLDIRHKLELLSLLRNMAKSSGITVIMSLHEIDLAQKISDKVLCVNGDEITHFGEPSEIFKESTIRELYGIKEGSYDVTFGSLEFPKVKGIPRVFVLSGCGSGIPVFRQLQKDGIPFAAGILYENDIDYQIAKNLAVEVVTEKPFCPLSDEAILKAKQLMAKCSRIIRTDFPIGPENERICELLREIPPE